MNLLNLKNLEKLEAEQVIRTPKLHFVDLIGCKTNMETK
jgi:hypothetical protein